MSLRGHDDPEGVRPAGRTPVGEAVPGEDGAIDAVTLEVVRGLLKSTAEEMGLNLIRTAYSHSIKERRDIATAVFDTRGRLIAQAEHIPLMLTGLYPIAEVAARKGLDPGDVLIANDPWNGGGSHLPDIALLSPVHHQGLHVGFVACIAHHADVGGAVPGSTAIDSREIYAEGLRIAPVRLVRAGHTDKDLLALILANCRLEEERERDLAAQMGSLDLGRRRVAALAEQVGPGTLAAVMDRLVERGRQRMLDRIRAIPPGHYRATDRLDHHSDSAPAVIQVEVTVADDGIVVDFDGTSPQLARSMNMVMNATQGAVFFAFAALLEPTEPPTFGTFQPIRIEAPEGSIVHAVPPAAVGGRAQTCPRVVDLIFMALAPALPDKVIGNSNVGPAIKIAGVHPRTRRPFIVTEVLGGGGGARAGKDGLDGCQMYVTNTTNMPVEFLESEYPVLIDTLALVTDSHGPGRRRGGLGIRKAFHLLIDEGDPAECGCIVDRHLTPPQGLFGGGTGAPGRWQVHRREGGSETIHPATSRVHLRRGDVVELATSGGGGYGDPADRDPADTARDLRKGLVTQA